MYKYLFQVDSDNQLMFDFQFKLLETIKLNQVFYNETYYYQFIHIDNINSYIKENVTYIPIGSMDFVDKVIIWSENLSNFKVKPIYIPKELQTFEFLQRELIFEKKIENKFKDNRFIKSLESYKDFVDVSNHYLFDREKEMVISSLIDILSEYRCFIYDGQLLSIRNYMGDEFIVPDKEVIERMIREYKTSPKAYTLDVGVLNSGETVVLEVHPFVSCGMYGADLNKYMIPMVINGFLYYKKQ